MKAAKAVKAGPKAIRTVVPWLIAGAILTLVARRIPLEEAKAALASGPMVALALWALFEIALALPFDAWAMRQTFAAGGVTLPFRELFWARGASLLLGALNHTAGQGGLGVYLARRGVGGVRAAGLVLFGFGIHGIAAILAAAIAYPFGGRAVAGLGTVLLAGGAAIVFYFALLAAAPRLSKTALGARWATMPLFEPLLAAGVCGHLRALVARLGHYAVVLLVLWGAFRIWGIPVPLGAGLALQPIVLLLAALPITPGGLGTAQAAQVILFSQWVAAANPAAREATMFTYSLAHHVLGLAAQCVIGLFCGAVLARRARQEPPAS